MRPYYQDPQSTLYLGDCRAVLAELPAESIQCVVTSPPYWGLRDYGIGEDALGLEPTPQLYVQHIVEIFREVRRVLREDGTVWLNLGDSYAGSGGAHTLDHANPGISQSAHRNGFAGYKADKGRGQHKYAAGLKPKDLCGIPWRVAFALQEDGWWLRSDIIWAKPNPMPESVSDRPTRSHEYVFLLTKDGRYYYDADAVREGYSESYLTDPRHATGSTDKNMKDGYAEAKAQNPKKLHKMFDRPMGAGRNRRSVWFIPTQPYSKAHFATYPEKLVEPCIMAGTSEKGCCPHCGAPWERVVEKAVSLESGSGKAGNPPGGKWAGTPETISGSYDIRMGPVVQSVTTGWQPTCPCPEHDPIPCTVLDPFAGSGTTGIVARNLGRRFIGIDCKAEYLDMARERIQSVTLALPL